MRHAATNWAISQRGLKPSAEIILLVLTDCHNPAYGCFPTDVFLADACELNRDTGNLQLAHLEEHGLIRRIRSIDPKTKRQRPIRIALMNRFNALPTKEIERMTSNKPGKGTCSIRS